MTIEENILFIRNQLPANVRLVVVSKTNSPERIMEAYKTGQRLFGENKVQELTAKRLLLPDDIEWHFIGHLQKNKVRQIIPFVAMIHGVDSLALLEIINREARKANRVVPVLLEFFIAAEESKFGLHIGEAMQIVDLYNRGSFPHVVLSGVMGMATFTDNLEIVRAEFQHLRSIFEQLLEKVEAGRSSFCELSMGMSDDFPVAIEAGSTLVRIGSKIFGPRIAPDPECQIAPNLQ